MLIPQGPCKVCGHSPLQHIWNRGCLKCRCTNYDVYSHEMTAAEWKQAAAHRSKRKHVDTWLRQQPHLFDKKRSAHPRFRGAAMNGPFRRGDLDELRQEGMVKANIPQPALDFGFTFGCRNCGSNAFFIHYAGAGVLQLQCVDCGKRFVPIAVAEGQAHSKRDLADMHKSFPSGIGGRNN